MQILLNGDRRQFPGPLTVRALLESLSIDARAVAVEVNRTVVRRQAHQDTWVTDGAEVEIVSFVGGGAMRTIQRRSGPLLLAVLLTAAVSGRASVVAPQQTPAPQAPVLTDETLVVYNGWAMLAAGDTAKALSYAEAVLAKYPRSIAAASLLVETEIVRGGGLAGLAAYERWLGTRRLEDGYLLRRAARGLLWDAAASPDVGVAALEYLAADDDPEARARLVRHMAEGSAGDTRALARIGNEEAIRRLIDQIEKTPGNKMYQIQALIDSKSQLAVPTLTKLLDDRNHPDHIAAAANGLGVLGAKSAIPALRRVLQDGSTTGAARQSAAAGLYKMNDVTGLPLLQKQLTSDDAYVRLGAAQMMVGQPGGVQPDAVWVRVVRELAVSSDPAIRIQASGLIAPYDLELARQTLERGLSDDNTAIRDIAGRLLIENVATDFGTLRRLLHSGSALTRVQAADRILKLTR